MCLQLKVYTILQETALQIMKLNFRKHFVCCKQYFDVSYRGVYFIDKDCNFRFIGTNPYYQSTANSIIISEN
jgi:hypothetical protein